MESAHRIGDLPHPVLAARTDEPHDPRYRGREIREPHEQWPFGIEEPTRHVLEHSGHADRHARAGADAACVSVGTLIRAAGWKRVHYLHIEPLAQEPRRTAHADDAGADDGDAGPGGRDHGADQGAPASGVRARIAFTERDTTHCRKRKSDR